MNIFQFVMFMEVILRKGSCGTLDYLIPDFTLDLDKRKKRRSPKKYENEVFQIRGS